MQELGHPTHPNANRIRFPPLSRQPISKNHRPASRDHVDPFKVSHAHSGPYGLSATMTFTGNAK